MELSKEEIKLLKLANKNKIKLESGYFEQNQMLYNLLFVKKLIEGDFSYDEFGIPYNPRAYNLTLNGQNELSKAMQKRSDYWKSHFYLPIITGLITGFLGFLVGKFS